MFSLLLKDLISDFYLTSAMGNLQQEHLNRHTRQEIITGTLTQVLSVLQELKDGNYKHAPSQRSLSSLQNEGSAPHPWSSSIDRHPRSGSDVSLSKRVSFSRDESHISAILHVSNADVGYIPHASSIDEDYGTHSQGKGRYQEDS